MKKTKLFTLLSSAVLISTAIPTISSCANTQNHVWLASTDKPTKDADANLKAKYIFGLDGNYETKDVKVTISSENKNLFLLNYFVSNNMVVTEVQYLDVVEEKTPVKFSVQFATKNWTQTINDLVLNVPVTLPADFIMLRKINRILANNKANTMKDALKVVKDNGIDVESLVCEEANDIYIWDQSVNRFVIINSLTKAIHYKTDDYEENSNKWQLWKMVDQDSFDEYSEYSQYLKTPSSNALTKIDYSFISGFDCGNNTDVRNVHYFYSKNEEANEPIAKDIIINTNSNTTNVDISAWDGNGGDGDTVTHYGTMGELTVVTNDKYIENGKVITCSVYDGEIAVDEDANITMTYVRGNTVILTDYKKTGTIDEIYTDSTDQSIKTAIESQGYTIAADHDVNDTTYQAAKEAEIEEQGGEVCHVFTVTGGAQDEYYETLSDIAAVTNATDSPELFEGKTIILNKDYDMSIESLNWTPICNGSNNFKGIIDGNEHTILNFNIETNGSVALITNNQGSVKNLNFVNCALSTTNGRVSLISLFNFGNNEFINLNFYNCSTKSTVSSGFAISYLLSETGSTALIQDCYTDENCYAIGEGSSVVQTGFISQCCTNNYVAGEWVKFKDCEMHLNIKSYYAAGSYVGQLGAVNDDAYKSFSFENCSAHGNIVIEGTAGNGPMGGGFIGSKQHNAQTGHDQFTNTTTFKNCQNYCNVYALDKYLNVDNLGGFIGYSNNGILSGSSISFENCTNSGQIGKINPDTSYTPNGCGGFVGRTMSDGNVSWTFTGCTNKGYIESSVAGHFIGILGSSESPESKQCINCSIEGGSLLGGSSRTKITGEPD